jgi:transglutaminase-like putative cysteine protease
LCTSGLLLAQQSEEFLHYKKLYPDARLVRLNQETVVNIALKDRDIDITQEFLEEDLYMNDAATFGSKKSLNFSAFFELNSIEASSLNFEDGKYRETKVEEFKEKDELDVSFYDDTKSLNFIYPKLQKGSKSKLKYSEKVKNPRFLSSFYFGDFLPIVNTKVTLIADKDISLQFREFNTEGLDIAFSKTEKKGDIIYTWEVKNSEEYDYESDVPSFQKVLPHIIPIITSYKVDGEQVNLLNDVSDLHNWYVSLVKDINKSKTDEGLVTLVKELTSGMDNELDKVKAIYYWTQQNIKYIAFEYALGGFIPREANDVFQKKYGDCKDNSSILHKMLEIAGLQGNLTWIGTRRIPYSYNEVPTPAVDNHMILSYSHEGKTYFLDATGRYTPMEFPSSFIQGKEALITKGDNRFELVTVPVVAAVKNAQTETNTITINGNGIDGNSKTVLSGYQKIDYFNRLENENTRDKQTEFYNVWLRKGSNKFLIQSFTETNKFGYEEDFEIDYSFTVDDYVKNLGDEIYINLNLNRELSNYKTEKDRKYEIDYDYKQSFSFTTVLKIPEGYELEYLPESIDLANELLSASISYAHENGMITYKHDIILNFLTLDTAQQKQVNELIKKVEKQYKEIVVLKKI